jgi:dipeptidyl aminopeptidase/acylaminoacyl peptidase
MKNGILLFFLLALNYSVFAQRPPDPPTSIYLIDVELNVNTGEYSFIHKGKINNWKGYNNQPFFTPNGEGVYFSCTKEDKQADIYYYDLNTNTSVQVTKTPKWKEYSPQLTPDEKHITLVRLEEDDTTQHLWQYNLDGTPDKMITTVSNVGYYCCFDSVRYALHMETKKNSELDIFNPIKNTFDKVDENIGRCLIPVKNSAKEKAFTYVNKAETKDSTYQYITLNAFRVQLSSVPVPKGCEDYCVGMNEKLWYGKDGMLYEINNGKSTLIADFNSTKLEYFYRLSYFPINKTEGKLAVVTYVGKKP